MSEPARQDRARFVGPFDRVLYLKTLPGVEDLDYGELAVLARQTRERHFKRGDTLLDAGQEIESLFLVVEGRVRIEKDGGVDFMAGPQDDVGMVHWLANETDVMAIAETDTLVLETPTAAFAEILEDHFSIFITLVRSFANSVYEQLVQTADGALKSVWDQDLVLPGRPLDLVERIVLLRRSPIFANVSLETIAQMASGMRESRFDAGTEIWEVGEQADEVMLILSGTASCVVADTGNTFRAGAGYPMGNIESMALRPRWYKAIAETDMTVLRGTSSGFVDAMEDQFDLAMTFLRAMAAGYLSYLRASSVPIPGGRS